MHVSLRGPTATTAIATQGCGMLHFLHFLNLLMLYSSMHSSNAQGDRASMEAVLNKQHWRFP